MHVDAEVFVGGVARLVPTPVVLSGACAVAAGFLDMNYGAIAAGLTLVGASATALVWNFAARRTEAFKESERAKLEAFKAAEEAKLELMRESELMKIDIQRQQDELNKASLSGQLHMMSGQLTLLQRSADEANRSLVDAREMNRLLREQLDGAAGRIEDANKKLHEIRGEYEVANLKHLDEKRELQAAKDALVKQLDQIQRSVAYNGSKLDSTESRP